MDAKPRYLWSLAIEAFKRIEVAYMEFGDHPGVTMITGENGNGKSSVLDAIEALLAGKSAMPSDAIHHGRESGRIQGKLGELVVTREFKRAADGKMTSTIKVESADGARYGSPQAVLDEVYGSFTFQPLDFLNRPQKDKYLSLRRFVAGIDFELMERLHQGDFDRRTDVNREAKRLRAAVGEIGVPEGTPKVRVSVERLSKELEKAGAANAEREKRLAAQAGREATIRRNVEEINRMQLEIDRLTVQNGMLQDELRKIVIPAELDTAELRRELTRANETNRAVDLYARKRDLEGMAKAEEEKSAALTKSIEERLAAINKAIEAAEMPYQGLTLRAGSVLLGGVPFEQASSAEQWRACVGIAMAENPGLRTILVRQGSLLDTKSMAIIKEMADGQGYQVICEKVDESGKIGIVLVDGRVASTPESRELGIDPTQLPPVLTEKGKRARA
jgi:hypothetical protein